MTEQRNGRIEAPTFVNQAWNVTRQTEIDLLLACARIKSSAQTEKRVTQLASQVADWPYLLNIAGEHGVRPLLYRSLNSICPDQTPEAVKQSLRDFVLENASCNLLLSAELLSLLSGFKERGIDAVPFKGPVLASRAYGDPGLRESNDLDILVSKQNLPQAIAFLLDRGYSQQKPPSIQAPANKAEGVPDRYNIFRHSASFASIDLQASLEGTNFSFSLDDPEFWGQVGLRPFASQLIPSFSDESTLILLAVHGAKDMWFHLKWICDIAEFIECHPLLRWDLAVNQATRVGAKRKLFLALHLANEVLGASLPMEISQQIVRDSRVIRAGHTIVERLFWSDPTLREAGRRAFYFQIADTSWDRTKQLLGYGFVFMRIMINPSEHDRIAGLPQWLSCASYLVRPVRLIAKYGKKPGLAMEAVRDWFRSIE